MIDESVPSLSGYTEGCSLLDRPTFQIPGISSLKIVAVSFRCQIARNPGLGFPSFGRMGTLYGGITLTGVLSPVGAFSTPFDRPGQPLPTDANLLTKIWDGSIDTCPPSILPGNNGPFLTVSAVLSPPIPIEIDDLTSLLVGIWLTPSLTQNTDLYVTNSIYTIVYDDAKGAP